MELKCDHIQSSCTLRELFVTGFTMFFSSRDSDGNAVAPENAKFTPCVKTASLFKYGFRFGTPNAFADHIHKKKKNISDIEQMIRLQVYNIIRYEELSNLLLLHEKQ